MGGQEPDDGSYWILVLYEVSTFEAAFIMRRRKPFYGDDICKIVTFLTSYSCDIIKKLRHISMDNMDML